MKSGGSKITCMLPSQDGVLSWKLMLPFRLSDRRFSETAGLEIYRIGVRMPQQLMQQVVVYSIRGQAVVFGIPFQQAFTCKKLPTR